MRARLPLLALSLLLPACGMERSASLTAPPVGAKTVRLCAAVDGKLRDFTGWVDPETGDTLVAGRRFREVFPAEYAGDQSWYDSTRAHNLSREPFWISYGRSRTLESGDLATPGLRRVGRVGNVDAFAVNGGEERPGGTGMLRHEVVYLPVHAGCVFQPYMSIVDTGGVRG
jgi:hypothetical protein